MASGKSGIVPIIIDLIPEHPPEEWYVPGRQMVVTAEKHDWKFVFARDPEDMMIDDVKKVHISLHNLLDGCQYIESGFPAGDRAKMGLTWNSAYKGFVSSVQRCISDGNNLPEGGVIDQKTVLMFDQSKHVSLAKKPEQNIRRVDRVSPDVDVVFPFEDINDYVIHDHEVIPDAWRSMFVYGKFKNKITDYILKRMFNEKPFKLDEDRNQNFFMWRYGKIGSAKPDEEFSLKMEKALESVGEYDFSVLRYMITVIEDTLEMRKKRYINVYQKNLHQLVFRIFSTDTDLLLNCLYFLEFVREKYDLSLDFLPSIIIISPWHSKRIIHVTNMFRTLKFKIEHDNPHGNPQTTIRSFVMTIYAWGNDQMPSPFFIVGKCYLETFLQYRPLFGHTLVDTTNDPEHKYPHQCQINGNSFKMLYLLAYAHKHIPAKEKCKLWTFRKNGEVDAKALEKHIITTLTTGKKALNSDKRPQGNDNIKARLIMVNHMLYSIEHGMNNIKGRKRPLSLIELHEHTHINLWEEYMARVNKEAHDYALTLGLISERSCIYYTYNLKPNKKDDEVERLIKYVEIIKKRFVFGQHNFNRNLIASCSTDFQETVDALHEEYEMK